MLKLKDNKIVLSEADITRQCIDYLRAEGWTCRRQHVGVFVPVSMVWGLIGQTREWVKKALGKNTLTVGAAGDPDWMVYRKSVALWYRVFYLEFKAEAGRVSAEQRARHRGLEADGHLVCISRGLDDLKAWMRENL